MQQFIRALILCFILVITIHVNHAFSHAKDSINRDDNELFITPLNLIDVINPALQIGYEHIFYNRLGLQIEGGPVLKRSVIGFLFTGLGFGTPGAWWTNSGYKLRGELKYYLTTNQRVVDRTYLSLELFNTTNLSKVTDLFVVKDSTFDYAKTNAQFVGDGIYDDFYSFRRIRKGINFKFGIKEQFKNISLDCSTGIGIVNKTGQEIDRANPLDEPFDRSLSFLNPGQQWLPNITFKLKIGYLF